MSMTVETIDAQDRGFLYGDGLFETVRVRPSGQIRWLDAHIARLRASALALGMDGALEQAVAALEALPNRPPGIYRVTMTRQDAAAPFGGTGCVSVRMRAYHEPAPPRLGLAHGYYLPNDPLANHKTTSYLRAIMTRRLAQAAGYDDALGVAVDGRVGEGSASSALFWLDEQWVLPPLDGLLNSVTRQGLITLMRQAKLPHVERPVLYGELARCAEIALCSAGIGVLAAASLCGRALEAARCAQLARLLEEVCP